MALIWTLGLNTNLQAQRETTKTITEQVTNMQKYSEKRLFPLGTKQSLRGHVAMKTLSSYTAYPAFLGK